MTIKRREGRQHSRRVRRHATGSGFYNEERTRSFGVSVHTQGVWQAYAGMNKGHAGPSELEKEICTRSPTVPPPSVGRAVKACCAKSSCIRKTLEPGVAKSMKRLARGIQSNDMLYFAMQQRQVTVELKKDTTLQ